MNSLEFCRWLWGFIEIAKPTEISEVQLAEIRNHLKLVSDIVARPTAQEELDNLFKKWQKDHPKPSKSRKPRPFIDPDPYWDREPWDRFPPKPHYLDDHRITC